MWITLYLVVASCAYSHNVYSISIIYSSVIFCFVLGEILPNANHLKSGEKDTHDLKSGVLPLAILESYLDFTKGIIRLYIALNILRDSRILYL